MKIDLYADGSDLTEIKRLKQDPNIRGFTTNPTLMRKSGVTDYIQFVQDVVEVVGDSPVSFEVFSDDLSEMEEQGRKIAEYGDNIYIKIPITNTKGISTASVIESLLKDGIKVNVTAVFTKKQIKDLLLVMDSETPVVLSIFAGRIADTGVDPKPLVAWAVESVTSNVEVLWASPREIYNLYEAESVGCNIITMTPSLIAKTSLGGKSLDEYSLDTVKMFYNDAAEAKYSL
jgi:transaldolase